ncbi:hypothetical protein [Candidatus Mesenet endosymbiont of Agriotes lineatus]|uniref:hypothetical protein n=1 Tax=Candidatus Mesenet endosymbiont of Agriotes lineatus TaxID=3077948 RepID=UPI0030CD3A60
MLIVLFNEISRLFVNDVGQPRFDHKSKYKMSLDTDVLEGDIEEAERTLRMC